MVFSEEAEATLKECRATLDKTEEEWLADQSALKEELSALEARQIEVREKREQARQTTADDELALYDKTRARYGSIAVTTLRDGVCGYCAVAPSSTKLGRLRSGRELLHCGNCGRILLDL
jgi:predicted  nucleic acid-binding Zn-ribbon protein